MRSLEMIAWAALTLVLWRMLGKLYQICRSGEMRGVESGGPAGDSCTHGDTGCSDRVVACSWQAASSIGAAAASAPQLAMHSRCEDIPRPLRRAAVGHVRAYIFLQLHLSRHAGMVYLVLSRDKLSKRQLVRTTRERRGKGGDGAGC